MYLYRLGIYIPQGREAHILGKSPGERLLATDFLRPDKTVDRHGNGAVDVLRSAIFREPHLAEGLADAHYSFEVADLVIFLPHLFSIY